MNTFSLIDSIKLPEGELPEEFEVRINQRDLMLLPSMESMVALRAAWGQFLEECRERGYEATEWGDQSTRQHVLRCKKRSVPSA